MARLFNTETKARLNCPDSRFNRRKGSLQFRDPNSRIQTEVEWATDSIEQTQLTYHLIINREGADVSALVTLNEYTEFPENRACPLAQKRDAHLRRVALRLWLP